MKGKVSGVVGPGMPIELDISMPMTITLSAPVLEQQIGALMAAIDDLKTAVANLSASITKEISAVTTAIQNAVASSGAVSATDAAAIVTQLQGLQKTVDSETTTLTTPAPAPAPAPTPTPAP